MYPARSIFEFVQFSEKNIGNRNSGLFAIVMGNMWKYLTPKACEDLQSDII